jgi:transmembrane sensor
VNSPKPPPQDTIAEAAALWFAKLDAGSADRAAFETWRDADPRHAAAFARIAATDLALDRVNGLALHDDPDLRPAPRLSRRDLFAGAAAVIVALVGGGLWFASVSRASAATPVGGRKTVTLPGGGSIDLNTDTKVSWRFDDSSRRIWLEHGEAKIVVPVDHRPCSIFAADTAVVLSGGSVNARLRNRAVAVSVLQGDCSVGPKGAADGQVTRVASNEAAVSAGGVTRVHAMTDEDLQAVSAWQRDELIFDGETLGAAVDEYNRYLTNKLEIADPALSGIRLGGRFKTDDPQGFLAALQSSFGIQVTHDSDGAVVLSR